MIPDKSNQKWESLVKGTVNHNFKMMAAGMCVSRNQRMFKRENSPQAMKKAVDNLHEFFVKFEEILQDDIKQIF